MPFVRKFSDGKIVIILRLCRSPAIRTIAFIPPFLAYSINVIIHAAPESSYFIIDISMWSAYVHDSLGEAAQACTCAYQTHNMRSSILEKACKSHPHEGTPARHFTAARERIPFIPPAVLSCCPLRSTHDNFTRSHFFREPHAPWNSPRQRPCFRRRACHDNSSITFVMHLGEALEKGR